MNNLQFYKARKKQLKLTNLQICELSGLPKRTVEDFFRGASANPRIDTVEAINKVLGIRSDADDWTEDEKAKGIGRHPIYLSDEEWEWQEIGSEILRIHGEEYYKMLKATLTALTKK